MAKHLFIRLVVYDASGIEGLVAAARQLRRRALRTDDLRLARFSEMAACCMFSVAEAYERLQDVSLERPVACVQMLPELCADLCACLETERPSSAQSSVAWCEDWFPALAALSADGAINDLVAQSDEMGEADEERAVGFSLLPAAQGWTVSTATQPPDEPAFTRYLRHAAASIEQWASGRLRALTRIVPTAP